MTCIHIVTQSLPCLVVPCCYRRRRRQFIAVINALDLSTAVYSHSRAAQHGPSTFGDAVAIAVLERHCLRNTRDSLSLSASLICVNHLPLPFVAASRRLTSALR